MQTYQSISQNADKLGNKVPLLDISAKILTHNLHGINTVLSGKNHQHPPRTTMDHQAYQMAPGTIVNHQPGNLISPQSKFKVPEFGSTNTQLIWSSI